MFSDVQRHTSRDKGGSYHYKDDASKVKKSKKLADHALGWRHEMKYIISESKAVAIARFIKPYLKLDHYSKLRPEGAYPIVSLYLDSDNLQLCRESLEGQKNRFKLRIRSYTDDLDYPRFFEIKRRVNTIIIKSRARVMHHDVTNLLRGSSPSAQSYKTDEEVLRQFQFYMHRINARPVAQVRYMRQAYEGDSENRVRVTFDRQLAYNVSNAHNVSFDGSGWQYHWSHGVILEIKFTAFYPAWLAQMVECFNLRQQSVSKYVSSIKKACLLGFCAPKIKV